MNFFKRSLNCSICGHNSEVYLFRQIIIRDKEIICIKCAAFYSLIEKKGRQLWLNIFFTIVSIAIINFCLNILLEKNMFSVQFSTLYLLIGRSVRAINLEIGEIIRG